MHEASEGENGLEVREEVYFARQSEQRGRLQVLDTCASYVSSPGNGEIDTETLSIR